MAEKKSCSYAGFNHYHDTTICRDKKCMKCEDGKWVDTGKRCPC